MEREIEIRFQISIDKLGVIILEINYMGMKAWF